MRYALVSGMLWGLDTVVLGIALSLVPLVGAAKASVVGACLHDTCCALLMLAFMALRGRLGDSMRAMRTRNGRAVVLGALLGGPVGMAGYLTAISSIGPGPTAVISAFYPAFGALLSFVVLKERMRGRQVAALFVALAAVMAIGLESAGASPAGDATPGVVGALVCVVGWGSEAVVLAWGMRDEAVDNETALQIRETTSALAYCLVVMPLVGGLDLLGSAMTSPAGAVVLGAAMAGTASYLFYYKGIAHIGAARAMALNISYSAWAVLIGVLVGMPPTALELACCAVVICATVLSATPDWSRLLPRRMR